MNNWQTTFRSIIKDTAKWAEESMREMSRRGIPVELYIWHTPANNGVWGTLRVAADKPGPEYELTCQEPLRGNVPYSHVHQWIADRVRRAPIIGA